MIWNIKKPNHAYLTHKKAHKIQVKGLNNLKIKILEKGCKYGNSVLGKVQLRELQ